MNEMTDALSGRQIFGTVVTIFPYAALVHLEGVDKPGYLHISQVTIHRIEEHLTQVLKKGDKFAVLVKGFDHLHSCWEVSRKAVIHFEQWRSSGLSIPGTKVMAKVLKVTESGAVVDVGKASGFISFTSGSFRGHFARNVYDVLYRSGYFKPNNVIPIVVGPWNYGKVHPQLDLYFVNQAVIANNTVCDGRVVFIDPDYLTDVNKFKVRDNIYAKVANGEIAWVDTSSLMVAEKTFPLGSDIPLIIKRYVRNLGMYDAQIDWSRVNVPPQVALYPGTIVDAKVVYVCENAISCLISDNFGFIVYRSNDTEPVHQDIMSRLCPLDTVRAVVVRHDLHGNALFRFLQLVK